MIFFCVCFAIDAITATVALTFFLIGLSDGTVSSSNILVWLALLGGIATAMGGGLVLRSKGHSAFASLLVLVLAGPSLLFGLFLFGLIVSQPHWN